MTLTLLLDLDDTILDTETDKFVRAYLRKLGTHLSGVIATPADKIIDTLLQATGAMINNRRPDKTLKEVFDEEFYPALGFQELELRPAIEEFYRVVYPGLKPITKPIDGSRQLVDTAFEKGWRIAIATNPLFPATAIRQRLEWAGFPDDQFNLIGSYESMHFAKPNPAYFSEIVARMGCTEDPAVMIGNDLNEDILPARQAGLAVYKITSDSSNLIDLNEVEIPHGSLADLNLWLQATDPESLCANYGSISAILAQMYATPAALSTLVNGMDDAELCKQPAVGEWSLTEIFCHLRDVECEVNLPRLALLSQESNPFVPAEDTDRWAEQRGYYRQDGKLALKEFTNARIRALDMLALFNQVDWHRTTRHAIFGPTTVQELFGFVATHDRLHIQQAYPLTSASPAARE